MRLSFSGRSCAFGMFLLSLTSVATAVPQVAPARYGALPSGELNAVTPNDAYTLYSGVGNGTTGQLFLIENTTTPTPADDRVTFDGVVEAINNYVTTPPVTRSVIENDVSLGGNLRKLSISVFTAPGLDLWPGGFVDGTTQAPLKAGGFGIGFSLPPAINGGPSGSGEILGWNGDLITAADMDIFDNTGLEAGNTGPLPLNVFFNSTTNWDGVFGVIFTDDTRPNDGVTNAGVYQITLNITYQVVPEPTTLACLFPLGGLLLRRRTR